MQTRVVVLPGLDGGTSLLESFLALAPSWAAAEACPLPDEPLGSYEELARSLFFRSKPLSPFVLVAESFSGPAAVLLAAEATEKVDLLVLCNTFVSTPLPVAAGLPWRVFGRVLPPARAVRHFMTGGDADLARKLLASLARVNPAVRASRYRLLAACDVREPFRRLSCPVLVIHSSADRLVPRSKAEEMLELLPDATLEEIDAPHLAFQTEPAEVWAVISQHFERAA